MHITKNTLHFFWLIAAISISMLACSLFSPSVDVPAEQPAAPIATEVVIETPDTAPIEESIPTEAPPAPSPADILRIVYTDGGNLWIVEGTTVPRQLTFGGADNNPQFSPDGSLILFERELPPNEAGLPRFELRVIATDGSREHLVVRPDGLPGVMGIPIESDTEMLLDRLPYQVEWFPNSRAIAFNTYTEYGYGLLLNEDLWIADLRAESVTLLLPDHEAGGSFAFSPDGTYIALATTTTIKVMNYPGGTQNILHTFDSVNTASEYHFYPTPIWSLDGSTIRVTIPSAEPFSPDAAGTLWQLPRDGGEGTLLTTISGNFLHDTLNWSPDQAHIAYAGQSAGGDPNVSDLTIANADASSPMVFATGNLKFLSWLPDSRRFIYWQNNPGEVYLGELGLAPMRLVPPAEGAAVFGVVWADADSNRFIYTTGNSGAWTLRIGQLGGAHHTIASPVGDFVYYDVHQ